VAEDATALAGGIAYNRAIGYAASISPVNSTPIAGVVFAYDTIFDYGQALVIEDPAAASGKVFTDGAICNGGITEPTIYSSAFSI